MNTYFSLKNSSILHMCLGLSAVAITQVGQAACDNFNPVTGQTTTCDSSAPNPTTNNIEAAK